MWYLSTFQVNLGHPPEDPDIYLPPQITAAVKPHQVGGIRFLYDNLIESLEQVMYDGYFKGLLSRSWESYEFFLTFPFSFPV